MFSTIEHDVHPLYRDQLLDYYNEALESGGQTSQVSEKAFSWQANYAKNGTLRELVTV